MPLRKLLFWATFSGLLVSQTLGLSSSGVVPSENMLLRKNELSSKDSKKRVAVLLCPAQFCVPEDYTEFFQELKEHMRDDSSDPIVIGHTTVAKLPRTEWIKVAKQLPTKAFFEARLPVYQTLKWYFDAIENAFAEIFAKEPETTSVCIIGHSIGGWVARAYLGGLSRSSSATFRLAKERCSSFITLGTPHISPEDALVDQTRGLLREIAESESCEAQRLSDDLGINITCVASSGLRANFFTTNVEEFVAASSYLPLLGRIGQDVRGDGIVPLDLAFMDAPANRIILERCDVTNDPVRHAHVIPTPWNLVDGFAPSIRLPKGVPSYVSTGAIRQWSKYIR